MRKTALIVFIVCYLLILLIDVDAKVSDPCANCHTMHYSQNGTRSSTWGSDGPYNILLINDCIGCHSHATSSTYYDLGGCKVPVVFYTGGEPATYLAGGNFYWVKEGLGGDDTTGQNVFLGEDDDNLTEAPGHIGNGNGCTNSCHFNLSQIYPDPGWSYGKCNDKYGCEGCHLVKHHTNDHPNGESGLVNSRDKGWYRFLADLHNPTMGVQGYEDGVWEAGHPNHAPGTTSHNVYVGYDASHSAGDVSKGNVSAFCGGCHENFDRSYAFSKTRGQEYALSGPIFQYWIRHPSDTVIPDSGEYASVGGDSHLCDPLSPVAEQWPVSDWTPSENIETGSDCVMCLSCHRPHGSPYRDMLRWDYTQQLAGGGGLTEDKGCFYCHTKKIDQAN